MLQPFDRRMYLLNIFFLIEFRHFRVDIYFPLSTDVFQRGQKRQWR